MKKQRPENDYVAVAIEARRNASDAEKALWEGLRRDQLESCRFRRKHFIDNYPVDFCCLSSKLAIFIENSTTVEQQYQAEAMAACMANGFRVVTFRKVDILQDLDHVLKTVTSLVTLGCATLKEEQRSEKKTHEIEEYSKRDKLRSDVDYLRGDHANADSSTLKIIRVLKNK